MHNRQEAGCTTGVGGEGAPSRRREGGTNTQPNRKTLAIISQTYRFTLGEMCTLGDLAWDGARLHARTRAGKASKCVGVNGARVITYLHS